MNKLTDKQHSTLSSYIFTCGVWALVSLGFLIYRLFTWDVEMMFVSGTSLIFSILFFVFVIPSAIAQVGIDEKCDS